MVPPGNIEHQRIHTKLSNNNNNNNNNATYNN